MDRERDTGQELPHPGESRAGSRSEMRAHRTRTRNLTIAGIVAVLAVAAILAWLFRRKAQSEDLGRPVPAPAAGNAVPAPSGPAGGGAQQPAGFVITLSREKLEAAQIKTEQAIQQ